MSWSVGTLTPDERALYDAAREYYDREAAVLSVDTRALLSLEPNTNANCGNRKQASKAGGGGERNEYMSHFAWA